jgi:hypothetical protein
MIGPPVQQHPKPVLRQGHQRHVDRDRRPREFRGIVGLQESLFFGFRSATVLPFLDHG